MKIKTLILFVILAGCQKEATQTKKLTANGVSNITVHRYSNSMPFEYDHLACQGVYIHFKGTFNTSDVFVSNDDGTIAGNEKISILATGFDNNGNEYTANAQTVLTYNFKGPEFNQTNVVNDRYMGKSGGGILKFTFVLNYDGADIKTIVGKITAECK